MFVLFVQHKHTRNTKFKCKGSDILTFFDFPVSPVLGGQHHVFVSAVLIEIHQ